MRRFITCASAVAGALLLWSLLPVADARPEAAPAAGSMSAHASR